MSELTHIDAAGNAVMVDVTGKDVTERIRHRRGPRDHGGRQRWSGSPRAASRRATCWAWRSWPASWAPSARPT